MEKFQPQLILCPTDFSAAATLALKFGKMISSGFEARILVLFAERYEAPPYFTPSQENRLIKSWERSRKTAAAHLARYVRDTLGKGAQADSLVTEDRPDQAILKTASARHADLIVMGTHGRSGWSRIMLGSVTERVLRGADRPVLTVGFKNKGGEPSSISLKKIICPVNYSHVSREALEHAVAMAERFTAELTVIHAIESPSGPQEDGSEKDRLCAWIPNELRPKCTFQEVVRRGNAAEQIIDLAASMEADLIVLGAQHKPFSDSTVIGTTTVNVTRHSPCPVLTVISK